MELTVVGYGTYSFDPTRPLNRGVYNSTLGGWAVAITEAINANHVMLTPGPAGTILTSNGTSWISAAPAVLSQSDIINDLGYTPYNATNPNNYISSINSGNVTSALGYTPYNSTNPAGYISAITLGNVITALGFTPYNATNPNGYISTNQSITLSGEVLGSGTTAITTSMLQPKQAIVTTSASISNTVTYISPVFFIGANTVAAGDSYIITVYGRFTNGLLSAGTSTFVVRLGTAGTTADAAIQTLALSSALSGTSVPFKAEFLVTFRTIGSSGTIIGSATVTNNGILGLLATASAVVDTGTPVTINTTQALKLGVSFVTNNASISAVFDQVVINRIR